MPTACTVIGNGTAAAIGVGLPALWAGGSGSA